MHKISIIVPVHNDGCYIGRCAESLMHQTFADIQYIFVDDLCSDRSMEILQEAVSRSDRSADVVLLKNDTAPSSVSTRLKGLQYACGEYVIFCDADDWIESNMIESMYEEAVKTGADMVICGYWQESSKFKSKTVIPSTNLPENPDMLSELLSGRIAGYLWNKLVKRSVWNDVTMDPIENVSEDFVWSLQLSCHSKLTVFLNRPLYHYCFNPNSLSRAISEKTAKEMVRQKKRNFELVLEFLEGQGLTDEYKYDIIQAKYNVRSPLNPFLASPEYYKIWEETFPEIDRLYLRAPLPLKNKIKYLLCLTRLEVLYRPIYRLIFRV